MNTHKIDAMDTTQSHSKLSGIREGMGVFDRKDNHIGKVDFVYFGAVSDIQQARGTGPASAAPGDSMSMRNDTLVDWLADAFHPNDVPTELRERLETNGFIRVDADGLFAADRFVTPDQIARVDDDRVQLTLERDQLIKRR